MEDPEHNAQLVQNEDNTIKDESIQQSTASVFNKFNHRHIFFMGAFFVLLISIGAYFLLVSKNIEREKVTSIDDANQVDSIALEKPTEIENVSNIEITQSDYYVDDNATLSVFGILKNNTKSTISRPKVHIKSFDFNGNVITEDDIVVFVGDLKSGEQFPFISNLPTNSIWDTYYTKNYVKDKRIPVSYEVKVVSALKPGQIKPASFLINDFVTVLTDIEGEDNIGNPVRNLSIKVSDKIPISESGVFYGGNNKHVGAYALGYDSRGKLVTLGTENPTKKTFDRYQIIFPFSAGGYNQSVKFEYVFTTLNKPTSNK